MSGDLSTRQMAAVGIADEAIQCDRPFSIEERKRLAAGETELTPQFKMARMCAIQLGSTPIDLCDQTKERVVSCDQTKERVVSCDQISDRLTSDACQRHDLHQGTASDSEVASVQQCLSHSATSIKSHFIQTTGSTNSPSEALYAFTDQHTDLLSCPTLDRSAAADDVHAAVPLLPNGDGHCGKINSLVHPVQNGCQQPLLPSLRDVVSVTDDGAGPGVDDEESVEVLVTVDRATDGGSSDVCESQSSASLASNEKDTAVDGNIVTAPSNSSDEHTSMVSRTITEISSNQAYENGGTIDDFNDEVCTDNPHQMQNQQPVHLQSTSLLGVFNLLKCIQRQTVRRNSFICDIGRQAGISVKGSNEERDKTMPLKDGLALALNRQTYFNVPTGQRIVTRSVSQKKYNAISGGNGYCLCKHKWPTVAKTNQLTFCQALDVVDGTVVGCINRSDVATCGSPAANVPVMELCKYHERRLHNHECCPGCGHFCTAGQFLKCQSHSQYIHLFHEVCQVEISGKSYCPHCGIESSGTKVTLISATPRWAVPLNDAPASMKKRPRFSVDKPSKLLPLADAPSVMTVKLNSYLAISTFGLEPEHSKKAVALSTILDKFNGENKKEFRKSIGPSGSAYHAIRNNSVTKLLIKLAEGTDPNAKIVEAAQGSLLHVASKFGRLLIVHCLLQAGALPNGLDANLCTPLMLASGGDHLPVVKQLIRAGSQVNLKNYEGQTALHIAAKAGHLPVVQYLVENTDIDIDNQDHGGWTALAWASDHVHVEVAKYLILIGSDPCKKDKELNTCLHWAAYVGSSELVMQFLSVNCHLEAVNANGDRALHLAARQGNHAVISLLLARGAQSDAVNNQCMMPHEVTKDETIKKALQVNKKLRSLTAHAMQFAEKLLISDISRGREHIPIPCVNSVDDMGYPDDFVYVTTNVESAGVSINRNVSAILCCNCTGDCSTSSCQCAMVAGLHCRYDENGCLLLDINFGERPIVECSDSCRCWTTCRNRTVQRGSRCRLQLFRTEKLGWGVRTLRDIPRGTFICEYTGEIISDHEADKRHHDSYLFDLDSKDGETFSIDGFSYGNVGRFINHHCDPNIAPVRVLIGHGDIRFPRICFFAVRDIMALEELGFDYGEDFWFIKYKSFTCECGSSLCKFSRSTIASTMAERGKQFNGELLRTGLG